MGMSRMRGTDNTPVNMNHFLSCIGIFGLVCLPPIGVLFSLIGLVYRVKKENHKKFIGLNIFILIASLIMCRVWGII